MNSDNFVSDIEAAVLIQSYGISSSVDGDGYVTSTLGNGDTLIHYVDPSKPLGWEYSPIESQTSTTEPAAAQPLEPAIPADAALEVPAAP